MPWLLWCFDRQSWPQRELLIVDSSPAPVDAGDREDVRVITLPEGAGVAQKRNLAVQRSRGEIVTWFDDDDWQHPDKVRWLVEALGSGSPYAGSRLGSFIDLMTGRCATYRAPLRDMIFNSAGFRRDAIVHLPFPEKVRRASDTRWMRAVSKRYPEKARLLDHPGMFFWLCHDGNLSNPTRSRRFPLKLEELKRQVGDDAWGDTDDALHELRMRMTSTDPARAPRAAVPEPQARQAVTTLADRKARRRPAGRVGQDGGDQPPVGVMIKATVLDVAYLDVVARHMIAQARFPFADRAIVVDRTNKFHGKYRNRERGSDARLDGILRTLKSDGVIDRVVEVDPDPHRAREVLGRYFPRDATRVPPYAATGGPIFPTLFGLESMKTDHVLQMDADILFHASDPSWVRDAIRVMNGDPRLWLMMTHPGPPAGPRGRSLGSRNARIAKWDEERSIWRFQSATTRYFLCDRRTLRGRLEYVPQGSGCAPLEQCITRALMRSGAFRGAIGDLESWHVHAWYHGNPFPAWAPDLIRAVEAGRFPEGQRGQYDLRLDRPKDRCEWQRVLQSMDPEEGPPETCAPRLRADHRRARTKQGGASQAPPAGASARMAVVIPLRNRAGQCLRNAIHSLQWQDAGRPEQIIIVSHGSRPPVDEELSKLCEDEHATLITTGVASEAWNKPRASNAGIRATSSELPYVMLMDADMILAPDFCTQVLRRLEADPPALVLCRSADLPRGVRIPSDPRLLLSTFGELRANARLRPRTGTGGIQAAPRSFFFKIRGYDEDLTWWGAMDGDVVGRARLAGLAVEWLDACTSMLHQWHLRKHTTLSDPDEISAAKRAWRDNHALVAARSGELVRNPSGWGGTDD